MNRIELGLTRLRDLIHGLKTPPLAQFLNFWELRDGVLVGVNLDCSTVYELDPQDAFLMDPAHAELFAGQSRSFLNSLPADCVVQFVVQVRKGDPDIVEEYRGHVLGNSADSLARLIADKKCDFISGKFTQRRRYLLFVTSHPRHRKTPSTWLFPTFKRDLKRSAEHFHQIRVEEHAVLEQIVVERLRSMGVGCRKLDPKGVLNLTFHHLNPRWSMRMPPKLGGLPRTLREQIPFSAIKEDFDHVQIDRTFFRGLTLFRLPETSHLSFTQRLLGSLWPDCDLVLTIESLDTENAMSGLKLKNNVTRTLAFSNWTKNYEAEQKHVELDELITEIRATAQRLFRFSLSVLVRGDSLDELSDKCNPVIGAFHDFASAEGAPDDMNHFRVFLQSVPGHGELNDRKFYVQTNALAGFFPITGTWKGSKAKKMLLETPLGELIGLDPFDPDLPAKHGLVLGTTGSGKSFTTNYLLNNFMIESSRNHVVIIDVGGSYRKIAKVFGGDYLEVSLSERFGFNPFPPRAEIVEDGRFDDDAVAYLLLLVSRMCAKPGQAVTTYERGFLEKAIKAAYSEKQEIVLADIRSELIALAREYPSAKDYADSLEIWTSGMYGRLFNRRGSLDAGKRMVVFDLQNLENHPDLQSVYFFVIRSIMWGKLSNRDLRKIIVIDEGWKFFNDPVGVELIESLYRTARKFNAAVFSISQSPKDFLDTAAANAIISNSYIKYILKLSKGHELLSQFELNAAEVDAVKALQSKPREFSDVFVKYGNRSVVARIEPCPLDYWICTTDAKDHVVESRVRQDNPGLSEAELLLKLAEGK